MRLPHLRRREHGQAVVILAICGSLLIALVGLALDGGIAVDAYRRAQNAADAGALAAARQIYENALAGRQSDALGLSGVASSEVGHNKATIGTTTASGGSQTTGLRPSGTMRGADGMSLSYVETASPMGAVFTGAQTVYVPNVGQGLTGESDLLDASTTAGSLLQPALTSVQMAQTRSSTLMQMPSSGGSVAYSRVAVGMSSAPSLGLSAADNCWEATATYSASHDTTGTASQCATTSSPVGVTMSGTLLSSYGTDSRVYMDNHPAAAPRVTASAMSVTDGGLSASAAGGTSGTTLYWDPIGGLTAESATVANGLHAGFSPSVGVTQLSVDVSSMLMAVAVSVNPQGATQVLVACVPTTVTLGGTLVGAATSVNVDSSCNASGLNIAGVSIPSVQPAPASACSTAASTGVVTCAIQACFLRATLPTTPNVTSICLGENTVTLSASPVTIVTTSYTPPPPNPTPTPTPSGGSGSSTSSSGSSSSTSSSASSSSTTTTTTSSTSSTSSTTATTSTTTTSGSSTSSGSSSGSGSSSSSSGSGSSSGGDGSSSSSSSSGSPSSSATSTSTTSSPPSTTPPNPWGVLFSGQVTVSAHIDQSTFFMGAFGFPHTTSAATATADVEPIVDESDASFQATPFGMPDMALPKGGGSLSEHLTPGHDYYLYGPDMSTNSPGPRTWGTSWQGQLAAVDQDGKALPHRVGNTVSAAFTLTTTPQPYLGNGTYVLEPIFDPSSLRIEAYGVFVPITGDAHWYELVNSQPASGGFVVDGDSVPGWITYDEGAVAVKLVQ